jgi:hypothetical protein
MTTQPQPNELTVLALEVRAGFAEARARDAEISEKISDLRAYLGQMFDAITDLRGEFDHHDHGDTPNG